MAAAAAPLAAGPFLETEALNRCSTSSSLVSDGGGSALGSQAPSCHAGGSATPPVTPRWQAKAKLDILQQKIEIARSMAGSRDASVVGSNCSGLDLSVACEEEPELTGGGSQHEPDCKDWAATEWLKEKQRKLITPSKESMTEDERQRHEEERQALRKQILGKFQSDKDGLFSHKGTDKDKEFNELREANERRRQKMAEAVEAMTLKEMAADQEKIARLEEERLKAAQDEAFFMRWIADAEQDMSALREELDQERASVAKVKEESEQAMLDYQQASEKERAAVQEQLEKEADKARDQALEALRAREEADQQRQDAAAAHARTSQAEAALASASEEHAKQMQRGEEQMSRARKDSERIMQNLCQAHGDELTKKVAEHAQVVAQRDREAQRARDLQEQLEKDSESWAQRLSEAEMRLGDAREELRRQQEAGSASDVAREAALAELREARGAEAQLSESLEAERLRSRSSAEAVSRRTAEEVANLQVELAEQRQKRERAEEMRRQETEDLQGQLSTARADSASQEAALKDRLAIAEAAAERADAKARQDQATHDAAVAALQQAHASELSSRITERAEAVAQRDAEAKRAQRIEADAELEAARAREESGVRLACVTAQLEAAQREVDQQREELERARSEADRGREALEDQARRLGAADSEIEAVRGELLREKEATAQAQEAAKNVILELRQEHDRGSAEAEREARLRLDAEHAGLVAAREELAQARAQAAEASRLHREEGEVWRQKLAKVSQDLADAREEKERCRSSAAQAIEEAEAARARLKEASAEELEKQRLAHEEELRRRDASTSRARQEHAEAKAKGAKEEERCRQRLGETEERLKGLQADLQREQALSAEARRAADQAMHELRRAHSEELRQVGAEHTEALAQCLSDIGAMRASAARKTEETEAQHAQLAAEWRQRVAAAEAELSRVRGELQQERNNAAEAVACSEGVLSELRPLQVQQQQYAQALAQREEELRQATNALMGRDTELQQVRQDLQKEQQEAALHRTEADLWKRRHSQAEARDDASQKLLAQTQAEKDGAITQLRAAHQGEIDRTLQECSEVIAQHETEVQRLRTRQQEVENEKAMVERAWQQRQQHAEQVIRQERERAQSTQADCERAILRSIETFYGQAQEAQASSRRPTPPHSRCGTPTNSREHEREGWPRQPDALFQTAAFGCGSPMALTEPQSPRRQQNASPPPSSSSLWPSPPSPSGVASQQRPGTPPRSRSAVPSPMPHARLQQQYGQNCGQPHGELLLPVDYAHGDYYDQGATPATPRSPRNSGRYDLTLGAVDRSPGGSGRPQRATSPWRVCM